MVTTVTIGMSVLCRNYTPISCPSVWLYREVDKEELVDLLGLTEATGDCSPRYVITTKINCPVLYVINLCLESCCCYFRKPGGNG